MAENNQSTTEEGFEPFEAVVRTANAGYMLKVREAPNLDSETVDRLADGAPITVIGKVGGWYQIGEAQYISVERAERV